MDKLASLLLDKSVEQLSYSNACLCIAISYTKGDQRRQLEAIRDQLAIAEVTLRDIIKPF